MSKRNFTSNRKFLVVMLGVLLFAMVVHFVLTITYNFRDQLPQKLVGVADRYTVPAFHQNWRLFAPDVPMYNTELEYRFAEHGVWSQWEDASGAFGFDDGTTMETVEQGFNSGLAWQVLNNYYAKDGRAMFDRMLRSPAYASAMFYIMKMHRTFRPSNVMDSVQARIHFRFTPPPGKAYTFQESYLELPAYAP